MAERTSGRDRGRRGAGRQDEITCAHVVAGMRLAYCEGCGVWLCPSCFVAHVQRRIAQQPCKTAGETAGE